MRIGYERPLSSAQSLCVAPGPPEGGEAGTRSLPAQALDHGSGYLAALGAIAGLRRRHHEGGSWRVQVSLARTGKWLEDLGHIERGQASVAPDLEAYLASMDEITYVAPPGRVEGFVPRYSRPAPVMGEHEAAWR